MGYTKARVLRQRQEHAKQLVARRIEKYERQLEKLKAMARQLRYSDWGEDEEKRI